MCQSHVHVAGHRVLDGDDIGQVGDACAFFGLHEVPGVGVAPHRDTDIQAIAERLVVLIEDLAPVVHEAKHRRMHDNVVGPAILRMQSEFVHRVEVLV